MTRTISITVAFALGICVTGSATAQQMTYDQLIREPDAAQTAYFAGALDALHAQPSLRGQYVHWSACLMTKKVSLSHLKDQVRTFAAGLPDAGGSSAPAIMNRYLDQLCGPMPK